MTQKSCQRCGIKESEKDLYECCAYKDWHKSHLFGEEREEWEIEFDKILRVVCGIDMEKLNEIIIKGFVKIQLEQARKDEREKVLEELRRN